MISFCFGMKEKFLFNFVTDRGIFYNIFALNGAPVYDN